MLAMRLVVTPAARTSALKGVVHIVGLRPLHKVGGIDARGIVASVARYAIHWTPERFGEGGAMGEA